MARGDSGLSACAKAPPAAPVTNRAARTRRRISASWQARRPTRRVPRSRMAALCTRLRKNLRLEVGDHLLRGYEVLALLELLHQLFEIGERFRFLLHLHQRVGEVEVDAVAVGELGIVLENGLEAIDRARIPLLAVVEIPDLIIGQAEAIARFAQPRLALRQHAAVRIARDEGLELLERRARLGLIALRQPHLTEVRHPELVLRIVGATIGRIERQEFAELVDG